jgi:NAD-dependent DNA ligase
MEREWIDENGLPPRFVYADRLLDRQTTELIGLAKGIVCDGVVGDAEVVALRQWVMQNPDVTVRYPGSYVAQRVLATLADGVVDEEERAELRQLLMQLAGEPEGLSGTMNQPTRLGFNDPPPFVVFDGREFVFTGTFAYGTRKKCEAEVTARGGRCHNAVTRRADFLVVGLISQPAWTQPTFGRKLEDAIRLRDNEGHRIAIIPEELWIEALQIDAQ